MKLMKNLKKKNNWIKLKTLKISTNHKHLKKLQHIHEITHLLYIDLIHCQILELLPHYNHHNNISNNNNPINCQLNGVCIKERMKMKILVITKMKEKMITVAKIRTMKKMIKSLIIQINKGN